MIQGWNSNHPAFAEVIKAINPSVIIELGSWKGASAVHMAQLCNATIYCVDTFLGSFEHIRDGYFQPFERPSLYEEFMENTKEYRGRIIPFPATTRIAARYFLEMGIVADMVYVDASHETDDVRDDIRNYWPRLREGGVMLGDDYDWPSVREAVDAFAKPRIYGDKFWSFTK